MTCNHSYHTANSRWVEISRGLDGIDVTWDTIGWERAAHEQVKVTLDPAGRINIGMWKGSSKGADRQVDLSMPDTYSALRLQSAVASRTKVWSKLEAALDIQDCLLQ